MPFDWTGLALFFPAVVAVFSAISFGNSRGWTSPAILGLLLVGACLGIAFVRREGRCTSPMLDLGLFRSSKFSAGITSGTVSYLVMFGVLFLVPFYLERGLRSVPGGLASSSWSCPWRLRVTAPIAGRLADELGGQLLTIVGMSTVAGRLAALSILLSRDSGIPGAVGPPGHRARSVHAPNNTAIIGTLHREQSGLASGVLNMARGVGTALGWPSADWCSTLPGGGRCSQSRWPMPFDHDPVPGCFRPACRSDRRPAGERSLCSPTISR